MARRPASLYAAGQAGERFAVRNSGAVAVIEGCGSNGCEYMTGGTVVVLGAVGDNFGAGFTGGMAFVLDGEDMFGRRANPETIDWQRVAHPHWEGVLRGLIEAHVRETSSRYAAGLMHDWPGTLGAVLAGGAEGVRQVSGGAAGGGDGGAPGVMPGGSMDRWEATG